MDKNIEVLDFQRKIWSQMNVYIFQNIVFNELFMILLIFYFFYAKS